MHAKIYLHRHFPNHLSLIALEKLSTPRLLAYYKKHRHLRTKFNDEDYPCYDENDIHYNGEFGTSVEHQINQYFDEIKKLLDSRENIK